MVNFPTFFLTLSSISAVLLGICVSLRNNSFSGLLHPKMREISVGDKDYENVLKRSGKWSTIAGGLFVISTLIASTGFLVSVSVWEAKPRPLWAMMLSDTGIFAAGIVSLGGALLADYIELDLLPFQINTPERDGDRPETEPVEDGESEKTP